MPAASPSTPGTGAGRVVAALRMYARLLLQPIDVLVLDTLLVGPFGQDPIAGGATVGAIAQHLGVMARLVRESLQRSLAPLVCTSDELAISDVSSDETDDEGARAAQHVRYLVDFRAAVPYAYAHLTRAFLLAIGSARSYCFGCRTRRPPNTGLRAVCLCTQCGANILLLAAQEAKRCFDALVADRAARAGFTPEQVALQPLFLDPMFLQQVLAWGHLFSDPLMCTAQEVRATDASAWVTTQEDVARRVHTGLVGGLVSPAHSDAVRRFRSRSGNRPLAVSFHLAGKRAREEYRGGCDKVAKRSSAPPWIAAVPVQVRSEVPDSDASVFIAEEVPAETVSLLAQGCALFDTIDLR